MSISINLIYNDCTESLNIHGLIVENNVRKMIIAVPLDQLPGPDHEFWGSENYDVSWGEDFVVESTKMVHQESIENVGILVFNRE